MGAGISSTDLALLPRLIGLARGAAAAVLDQLYPPLCLHCERPVATADALCAGCFALLRPITAPCCPVLGIPFEVPLGPDARSAEAIADPPPFGRARSAVLYNEVARRLVSRLKYGDRPEMARFCARMMAVAGRELWQGDPVIVPVPLHRWRLWSRGYNQAALLAGELERLGRGRLLVDGLERRKRTPSLGGLGKSARRRALSGAIAVRESAKPALRGRDVLLVDDVLTSGATSDACVRVLRKAGARSVRIACFARVLDEAIRPDTGEVAAAYLGTVPN